jgi:hypothetical protein
MVPAPPSRSRRPSPKGTSAPVFGAGGAEAAVGSAGAEAGTGAGAGAGAGEVIAMPMSPPADDVLVDVVPVVCGAGCDVVELELEPRLPIVAPPSLRPFTPEAPSALEVPADELWVEVAVEVELDVVVCTSGVPSLVVEPESVLVVVAAAVVVVVVVPASVVELLLVVVPASVVVVVPASLVELLLPVLVVVPESVLVVELELEPVVVVELEVVVVVPPPVDPVPGSPLGAGQSIQKVLAFCEFWAKSILKW